MSQKQQNKFLVIYGAVTAVLAVGLGYLCYSQSASSAEAEEMLTRQQETLRKIRGASIYPNDAHVDKKKGEVKVYVEQVDKLHQAALAFQQPLNEGINGAEVQTKLGGYKTALVNLAAGRKVELPAVFQLGLNRYAESAPLKSAAPQVDYLVESLNVLLNTVVQGNITKLDLVDSPEQPYEKEKEAAPAPGTRPASTTPRPTAQARAQASKDRAAAAAAKKDAPPIEESEVLIRYPIRIAFTGGEQSIQEILNKIGDTPPGGPFFSIKAVRIENEKKDGPPRTPWVQPPPPPPPAPEILANVIMGREKVTAYLDMDMIYVKAPPTTATAGAP